MGKYRYSVRGGVTKIKTNSKKYLATGIATTVLAAGVAVPALAAKPANVPAAAPKATGGIGWSNSGAQAYDDFNAIATSTSCTSKWDVSGNYNLAFNLHNDATMYTHAASLTQTGGSVSGSGYFPIVGPHQYEWTITSGSVTGNTITFTADYTFGADAVTPLTTMIVNGTIASNGAMSGTWTDNYLGGSRSGEWSATAGTAKMVADTGCTGKGNFTYSDANGINYVMDVKYVNVSGNSSWFAGPTTSGNFGIGTWIFIKVTDNGEPGIGHDQIWGQVIASDAAAKNAVATMATPGGGPFTITSGNLQVH